MGVINAIKGLIGKVLSLPSFLNSRIAKAIIENAILAAAKIYKNQDGSKKMEAVVAYVLIRYGVTPKVADVISDKAIELIEQKVQEIYNGLRAKGKV
jgi:hypothetical protein